jgi:glutathione S-transferase
MSATVFMVGRARGKFGVKAPATSGHEGFERVFRVQMNTQEAALMFLPALWVAAAFGIPSVSAWIGAAWLVGRAWYAWAYARGGNRGPGFLIGMLALLALLVQGGWGIAATLLLA